MKMAKSSPKQIENTVGKREIALYEQFLLFPQFFFKWQVLQKHKTKGLFGKGLTDDLELGTNRKVLLQGIPMWNMKTLILTNQKIWTM